MSDQKAMVSAFQRSPASHAGGRARALRNPNAGIVEAEDIDHDFVLEICRPYLGELVGIYGDWTPLLNRNWPFGENMDTDDPWQFKNIRVM
jgi:homospermidine synthase